MAEFALVRRGYDPAQVDDHLAGLDGRIRSLTDAAAAATERADRLAEQVAHLSAAPATTEGLSERIRTILQLAHEEAAAVTGRAAEAERRNDATRRELDERLAALATERDAVLARSREEADAEAERIVAEARASVGDAERHRAHMAAELHGLKRLLDDAIARLPRAGREPGSVLIPEQRAASLPVTT